MKKISAMSLLSLLLIMTMIVVMMAASAPMITQNLTKISKGNKSAGEVSLDDASGYFVCYYNYSATGQERLCHKQIEFDLSGNIKTITEETCGEPNSTPCKFIIPDADSYEVMLVGGGGGGAIPEVENNFDYEIASKNVGFTEDETEDGVFKISFPLTSIFEEQEQYISAENTGNIFNSLLKNSRYCFVRKGLSGTCCSNDYIYGSERRDIEYNTNNTFNNCSGPNNTIECPPDLEYSITTGGTCQFPLISNLHSLEIKLITFATEVQTASQGKPGEYKKYTGSFVGNVGSEIEIRPCSSGTENNCIGQGGAGGNNTTDGNGTNGGITSITINDNRMIARGGSGGFRNTKEPKTLRSIKLNEKGKDGEKPLFFIPSQLGINQTNLRVGIGSGCNCRSTPCSCTEIKRSTYPGGSGASSGYTIGTDNASISCNGTLFDLMGTDMVKIKATYNGSNLTLDTSNYCISPSLADNGITSTSGGNGANGAILIKW